MTAFYFIDLIIFVIDHAALHKSEAPDITTHRSVLNISTPPASIYKSNLFVVSWIKK